MKNIGARLVDIAKQTGFSATTVSLALNDNPRISSETKKIVREAARELNYVPNNLARSLVKRGDTRTVGVIVRDLNNPLNIKIAEKLETILTKQQYLMIMLSTRSDAIEEINTLIGQQVGGILIYSALSEKALQNFERLRKNDFPIVLMNSNGKINNLDIVYLDREIGAYKATKYLLSLGHKRIAILSTGALTLDNSKLEGYRSALQEAGLSSEEKLIFSCKRGRQNFYQSGYDLAEKIFASKDLGITAVFATMDSLAVGFLKYCSDHGISVPEEISVIGYDNIDVSAYLPVPLTTVAYDVQAEAAIATDLLFRRMQERPSQQEPVCIRIEPQILERMSCKRI